MKTKQRKEGQRRWMGVKGVMDQGGVQRGGEEEEKQSQVNRVTEQGQNGRLKKKRRRKVQIPGRRNKKGGQEGD